MNDNMGMKNDNMMMKNDNMGMKSDNMGMMNDNMGMKSDNMGMKHDNMGMKSDNMMHDNMGMKSDNMGMKHDNMGMMHDNMGMGMAPIKFYYFPLSQPSRSVHTLLLENHIKHEVIVIDLQSGKQRDDSYKKINPAGQVPAIDDGGFFLGESAAILSYLSNSRKLPDHWYPADIRARARVDQYLHWHHQHLRKIALTWVSTYLFKNEDKKKEALEGAVAALKQVEHWLTASTNGYIAGGTGPSIADVQAYHEILVAIEFKFVNIDEFPHINKWFHKLSEREAFKQSCVGFHEIKKHFK